MVSLKKFDLSGKETGHVEISDDLLESQVSPQMIKEYLVALRQNQRQWSANTKGRKEVNHSHQKPHPQKGTGNARQGFLGAAQYKGGGVVFGPKPKFDQHIRINRKERRAAIKALLADRIKAGKLRVLDFPGMNEPKTKTVAEFLSAMSLTGTRALFLGSEGAGMVEFSKSVRNLQKTSFKKVVGVNGYDLALCQEIIVMHSALEELKAALGGKSHDA